MTGFAPLSTNGTSRTQKFAGKAFIVGPQWTHLPTLTIGLLGVQIFWSVEMGYASPYLLSLGLSKSAMAVVFLAGPLSGLIMQPVIGALADTSTSRFGRRRPLMLIGTVICVLAMLLLGYTRGFASLFTTRNSSSNNTLTTILAVLAIYFIDFSINAVMAMDRALLVDTLPPSAQADGNAWAARMLGVGAVVGFFVGTIPLTSMFPFLGTTQLQVLSVIVSLLLLGGHLIMIFFVKERVLLKSTETFVGKQPNIFIREARELWSNLLTLPPVIRQICVIQFFAWIAWFPLLFYTTIYIGDLYKRSTPLSTTETLIDRDAEATRLGTRALFFSAILSLFLNLVLPAFVATPATRTRTRQRANSRAMPLPQQGAWSWVRIPDRIKVNLASLWAMSHLVLAGCMLGTFFTDSVAGATLLITITGFSWAITQWAPFSLLAEAILTTPEPSSAVRNSILLSDARTPVDGPESGEMGDAETAVFLQRPDDGGDESDLDEPEPGPGPARNLTMLGNHRARVSRLTLDVDVEDGEWEDVGPQEAKEESAGGLSAKAGIILGIHNVFVVIPQFLVTGISAVVFAIFDPTSSSEASSNTLPPTATSNGTELVSLMVKDLTKDAAEAAERGGQSNSVVYIFRFGGIAALVAFILCWRLARDLRHR
ncbi:hypothetical protein H0H81_011122 [Sphagnurus paluster]|uniref:Major facilitator superfamily (MFS) profile domain-containing protein n=1 Tax=Sphagnurus paluster TaxID=117069 RepID=A0A9P7GN67_9AGAR|nr:hypothetical protein H0H81_011122 [Sphagnurus paluster]